MFMSLLNEGGLSVKWLMRLLSASHQIADVLAQNPELGAIFFEPWDPPDIDELLFEGRRMMDVATSHSHRLDRLRLMKQRWTLRIAYVDINRLWSTASVLEALSTIADAIIRLTLEVTWRHYAAERGLPQVCPVQVVAFGKLGGGEVNYSSDIDLAYLLDDDADEKTETAAGRFCTIFGRAMEDQMGRGMLYRVDLRLRPYGGSGPVVNRMRAVEAYYDRYAETWEHLALIRSRVVGGSLGPRWDEMRRKVAFGQSRGAWQIDELLHQRARMEEIQKGDDLKRGPGGIRDIEFLVQSLQLVHARRIPELQIARTLDVIDTLADHKLLEDEQAKFLIETYSLYRTLEHWLQLEANRQTHSLPENMEDRRRLAKLLGLPSEVELDALIAASRQRIRAEYEAMMRPLADATPVGQLELRAGPAAPSLSEWMQTIPEGPTYLEAAMESEGGVERLALVVRRAPVLLPELQANLGLLEQAISGEIMESVSGLGAVRSGSDLAGAIRAARARAATSWVLSGEASLSDSLDGIMDAALQRLLGGAPLECVALGSYGTHDSGWESDLDLVLLCPPGVRHLDAEQAAQSFLKSVQDLRSAGAAIQVDLRLRPEGKSGMLARTYEGFRSYVQTDMDAWERLAAGRSRLIVGSRHALELIHEAADSKPFGGEMLAELLHVKRRLETELMNPAEASHNIKHGPGGFDDLGWMIQLLTMSRPELRNTTSVSTPNRLRDLLRGGMLNAVEFDALVSAHRLLLDLRWRLELLGFRRDSVPENPEKLAMLAESLGYIDGNSCLDAIRGCRGVVRQIFEDQVERLRRNFNVAS